MKSIIFTILFLALASGAPTPNSDVDAQVIIIPVTKQNDFRKFDGFIDTGVRPLGYFTNRGPNPQIWDVGIYSKVQDVLKHAQDQVFSALSNAQKFQFEKEVPDDEIRNITSTSKIINGHKVIVNNTEYRKKTEFGTSVFKIRTVDVQPINVDDTKNENPSVHTRFDGEGTTTNGGASPPSREIDVDDVEVIETLDNKGSPELLEPIDTTNAESIPDLNNEISTDVYDGNVEDLNESIGKYQVAEEDKSEKDETSVESLSDESNDNINRDDELEHTTKGLPESLEDDDEDDRENNFNYDIDNVNEFNVHTENYDFYPIDLSHDIDINQMQADQGAEFNPDAEIFDVHSFPIETDGKFEIINDNMKLTDQDSNHIRRK